MSFLRRQESIFQRPVIMDASLRWHDGRKEMAGYVYILASGKHGTLYIGVTSNLPKRVWEHKQKAVEGFTGKYDVDRLVYYEIFDDMTNAITREKQMKKWNRDWKIKRIEETNPDWDDLYNSILL